MKKALCFFLATLLLLSTAGCSARDSKIENPVTFYYRTASVDYSKDTGVIGKETRESKGMDYVKNGRL